MRKMHSVRLSTRFNFLTGTALALILTASTIATAAPQNSNQMQPPQPAPAHYSTPGSMPKPSTAMDDGIRFSGSLPGSSNASPLAPASNALRDEPAVKDPTAAKPVSAPAPERSRAQAEPEAAAAAPASEPAPRPVAAPAPAVEPMARPVATSAARQIGRAHVRTP